MKNDFFMTILIIYFMGILNTAAIYHLFIFIGRRKDKTNISYLLLNISMACILFIRRLYPYFNNYNESIYQIFIPLALAFFAIMLNYFPHTIFNLKKFKFTSIIIGIGFSLLGISGALFYIITKNSIISDSIVPALSMPYALYIIGLCIYVIVNEKNKSKYENIILYIYIAYLIDLIFTGLLWGVFNIKIPMIIVYFPYILVILSFALILTTKFNLEHKHIIDLTNTLEHKVMERTKDLQKAKDQIEQKEKQKTIAFTNIFHEIKTPLTLISNYVERHIKNCGVSKEINVARDNIDKLKRDVLNALDFEKLDRGMVFYNHSQIIDLSDIVKLNIFMFKELANRKNIKIKYNIQDHIYTKIDKNSIDRIINNLLDNAIKYTPENGEINITLKADDKNIDLIINDTGIGISKEEQKNIFKPYYQISHSKSNIQGIGMGLNIVKKIITEVKGSIQVESEKDKGTTFIVKLERYYLKEEDKIEVISKDKKPAIDIMNIKLKELEYKEDKPNVFVVEDNIQMLSYLQESLHNDYNFFHASNGKEALELIEKIKKPDIIISDIMMDQMDGYEFYDELKSKNKKYKSIPFIFLTAKTREDEKIKGLKKGAIDFITKPFSIEELLARVRSIINNEKNKRENDIIEMTNEVRNYLINKSNNKEIENKDVNIKSFEKLFTDYGITNRETEVLDLLFKGFLRKEIAYKLNISMSTVKTYLNRIYNKCNVESKKELFKIFNIKEINSPQI